jgi:predicted aspartyl protease
MSTFQVEIEVGDAQGERWQKLNATAGTRATFAWVPLSVLAELGVQPEKRISLRHPDGRLIKRDVGQTMLRIGDASCTGTVVFGAERDPVLVGSSTLEGLHLVADPQKGTLAPAAGQTVEHAR